MIRADELMNEILRVIFEPFVASFAIYVLRLHMHVQSTLGPELRRVMLAILVNAWKWHVAGAARNADTRENQVFRIEMQKGDRFRQN